MMTFGHRLEFLLLPASCVLCGRRGTRRADLCATCHDELPWLVHACSVCALPLTTSAARCGNCLRQPPPQSAALAAFRYAYPLDALIRRFKFHGDLATGRVLGELLARSIGARIAANGNALPELLLPVPLHTGRLRERGFNQAGMLAETVARGLDIPMESTRLLRARATAEQSGKSAATRRRNVRGAFALDGQPLPKHVAIVDDVVTTGSTVGEIARLLLRAGVNRVEVWSLARTP